MYIDKSNVNELRAAVERSQARSAWNKGVKEYALELVDGLAEDLDGYRDSVNELTLDRALLNGAASWAEYSRGGCALVYDGDIAARLCTKSEYRKTNGGAKNPNQHEDWIDVQGRALYQAAELVRDCARSVSTTNFYTA